MCGGEAQLEDYRDGGAIGFAVHCQNYVCQVAGPTSLKEFEAVELWNKRPIEGELLSKFEKTMARLDKELLRSSACMTLAEGSYKPGEITQDDDRWSTAYKAVERLAKERDDLLDKLIHQQAWSVDQSIELSNLRGELRKWQTGEIVGIEFVPKMVDQLEKERDQARAELEAARQRIAELEATLQAANEDAEDLYAFVQHEPGCSTNDRCKCGLAHAVYKHVERTNVSQQSQPGENSLPQSG
jgi:hypothetical protein